MNTKTQNNDWRWILIGLLITAVSVTLYFSQATIEQPQSKPAPAPMAKPEFEFYTLLPRSQVNVPEPEPEQQPIPQQTLTYTLQVASLPTYRRADHLKAQLTLQGYDAQIESSKGTYRVTIGPFKSKSQAEQVRDDLRLAHIDSLLRQSPA